MTLLVALVLAPIMIGFAILLFDFIEGRQPDWPILWMAVVAATVCFVALSVVAGVL